MNKLILVTGAGGFVGETCINLVMQINVIGIDNLSNTDVSQSDLTLLIIGICLQTLHIKN